MVAPELTSELLHCLSTLPDPWPLAKITINMDSASQWVSRMCRLFFADDYIRHTEGTPSASQTPNMESAFQAVQNALPKLENRVIEFLAEWLVALLAPARHVLETRSPHLSFMLQMIPPMYHSLRRESVKSTDSGSVTRVKSVHPTWFQDTTATRGPPPSSGQGTPEPMHGLRLPFGCSLAASWSSYCAGPSLWVSGCFM